MIDIFSSDYIHKNNVGECDLFITYKNKFL